MFELNHLYNMDCMTAMQQISDKLQQHIEYAKELTREALLRGDAPVTVHLYMTQCLTEEDATERGIGLAAGQDIIERCDTILVGYRFGISEGMEQEMNIAKEKGIRIQYHS